VFKINKSEKKKRKCKVGTAAFQYAWNESNNLDEVEAKDKSTINSLKTRLLRE
jgi:hypothetical protein